MMTPVDATSGERPAVTVVVPAFRRATQLRNCLEALAAQDYPTWLLEVVVVDDGSPQPLAPVTEDFAARLRISVHRQRNAGPSVARNVGARRAAGALLAFTDDDCEPAPDWVRELARAHLDAPTAILGGTVVNALPDDRCAQASQLLVSFLHQWFADDQFSRFFTSNNLAVGRGVFLSMAGFDTSFSKPGGEDRELCERWHRAGRRLVDVPGAVVRHSHAMDMRGFLRQHWNYGRGAHDLHRRRRAAGGGGLRVQSPRFYLDMVRYPLGRVPSRQVPQLVVLLILSQAATAVGFAWQSRMHTTTGV
jgi:glycosyltransferase involved in cell wall biosynthesis